MKWKRGSKSRDVIDIRGASGGSSGGSRSSLPIPSGLAGAGGGVGLIVVVVIVGINLLGGGGTDGSGGFSLPSVFGQGVGPAGVGDGGGIPESEDPQADLKDFSSYVFTDTQDVWEGILAEDGGRYERAELVLYSDAVSTDGCGDATSAVGPFYCPADERVYLDLTFYEDMRRQLGASGDFAWAYVIAHEMGHHIQLITGTSGEVDRLTRNDPEDANELSVRQELQADCYAGVWASSVFAAGDLEKGDIDEAFNAAEAVGDDRLQKQAGGSVNPDSFTHGSSEQRHSWFDRGYESGEPGDCDTFSTDQL